MNTRQILATVMADRFAQGARCIGVDMLRCLLNSRLPDGRWLTPEEFRELLDAVGAKTLRNRGLTVELTPAFVASLQLGADEDGSLRQKAGESGSRMDALVRPMECPWATGKITVESPWERYVM